MDKKNRKYVIWTICVAGAVTLLLALTIEHGALVKTLSVLVALNVFFVFRLVRKKESAFFSLVLCAVWLIFSVLAFFLQLLIVEPVAIPTQAMSPTLQSGKLVAVYGEKRSNRGADRVWVVKLYGKIERGDIVAFRNPQSSQIDIKRCMGLPGEKVQVKNNRLFVDDREIMDPYGHFDPEVPSYLPNEPVQIPPDHYFFLGDNRNGSFDSRMYGPIPKTKLIGKVWMIYWPLRRMTNKI